MVFCNTTRQKKVKNDSHMFCLPMTNPLLFPQSALHTSHHPRGSIFFFFVLHVHNKHFGKTKDGEHVTLNTMYYTAYLK